MVPETDADRTPGVGGSRELAAPALGISAANDDEECGEAGGDSTSESTLGDVAAMAGCKETAAATIRRDLQQIAQICRTLIRESLSM